MVPDEFPQDAADAHLLLGGQFLARDDGVGRNLHLVFLEAQLDDLVAQADKSDARRLVATVHHHKDSFSHFIVVVEEMNWIGVVFHGAYVLVDDANIGVLSKQTNFSHLIINIGGLFLYLCSQIDEHQEYVQRSIDTIDHLGRRRGGLLCAMGNFSQSRAAHQQSEA